MNLIKLTFNLHRVLNVLNEIGAHPIIVGGCVRDALMGDINPKDIDIEIYGVSYDEIVAALRNHFSSVDVFGASFSVVKVCVDDESFDISLPRREIKSGDRHTDFDIEPDPDMTFKEASLRRDFTMNAIGWDPINDEVIDPHGGKSDIEWSILSHVSDRFAEDPLRVLRGMQFAARFDMTMVPSTVEMCRSLKDQFHTIPVERVWTEWHKLFSLGVVPSMGLKVLRQTEWIEHFPELQALIGVPQDASHHPEGDAWTHTHMAMDKAASLPCEDKVLTVAATMLHDLGKVTHTQIHEYGRITSYGHAEAGVEPAKSFLKRIAAPTELTHKILPIVREHMCALLTDPTPTTVRRLIRRLQPATLPEWATVVEADRMGRGIASHSGVSLPWLKIESELDVDNTIKPILKGEMLIEAGLRPGRLFGYIIKASLGAQDDGVITDDVTARCWLATFITGMRIN